MTTSRPPVFRDAAAPSRNFSRERISWFTSIRSRYNQAGGLAGIVHLGIQAQDALQLGLAIGIDDVGGRFPGFGVHAHIQGRIEPERESPFRCVELVGRYSQVGQDPVEDSPFRLLRGLAFRLRQTLRRESIFPRFSERTGGSAGGHAGLGGQLLANPGGRLFAGRKGGQPFAPGQDAIVVDKAEIVVNQDQTRVVDLVIKGLNVTIEGDDETVFVQA